jgi:copper(I)-binding protein
MKLPLLALCGALFALPAFSHEGVHVTDPFARFIGPSGAAYFRITNHADEADRLVSVSSPDAGMVMIMTSAPDANGVMKMSDLPDGIEIPGESSHDLAPEGDHVMLMSPTHKVAEGETVTLVLTFEHAGEVTVTVPVMNKRMDPPGAGPTDFDTASGEHAEVEPGAMSTPEDGDKATIVAAMKAMFEKPEAPLTVEPVVVMGDSAVASWSQGDMAGRALLAKADGKWSIVLCAGPELRGAEFLAQNGVEGADHLSAMFNAAEDALGADAVTRFSSFNQVVMMSQPANP